MALAQGTEVSGNIKRKRFRGYFFTINNVTDEEQTQFKEECKFWAYQIEMVTTRHLQGIRIHKNPIEWSSEKERFPRANIEPIRSMQKSYEYVNKTESRIEGPFEGGIKPASLGGKGYVEDIIGFIREGGTIEEIKDEFPKALLYHRRAVEELVLDEAIKKSDEPREVRVRWLYGDTGTGKTTEAFKYCKESGKTWYRWNGTKWWNGYTGQDIVWIDDFRGQTPMHELIQIIDIWPGYQVETKGGQRVMTSTEFIFTSSKHPKDLYMDWEGEKIGQLLRRIHELKEMRL